MKQSRMMVFALLVVVVSGSVYTLFTIVTCSYPFKVPLYQRDDPVPTRRALAKRILGVERKLKVLAGKVGMVDSTWVLELLSIAAELDPRISAEDSVEYQVNSTLISESSEGSTTTVPKKRHVCPEVYRGRQVDYQLQSNFMQLACDYVPDFKDVLSVIISTKRWEYDRIRFVVENMRKHYDVNIYILTYNTSVPQSLNIDSTYIKVFTAGQSESYAINEVVTTINTPFTLLANSLTHFSGQWSLERLVRVLDELETANVASGAYRTLNGHWNHGCLQQRMENYQLVYTRGYEHSKHECMFCDDVLGPFVVRTDFLKRVPLTESLEGIAVFHDWFLNVRLMGSLVVACPDVMFFVDTEPHMVRDEWLKIAKKWSLQYIQPFEGNTLEFSCEEAEITCNNIFKAVSSFLLPPCCRMKLRHELGYVEDCARELGVYCELQAGSLLGAVKADGVLPWDLDIDVTTDCKDEHLWFTKGMECMRRKNCRSVHVKGDYWTSTCEISTIDISCRYNVSIILPAEYRDIPTQIDVDGKFSTVKPNPGLAARNYYGYEYLKHAVHWRYSSNASSPNDDSSAQAPGTWGVCKEPGFHSCLDHFPVDGNLIFKRLNCQLN
ncbi:uncharacterized protein [Procambarus clarkii]|uniref:uncharacterized protein n=1 Tax=Procambarus clarkii TaxID=6728 RepID=UPI003743A4ED